MAKDIPDFMRGFDLDDDWGMTCNNSGRNSNS